MKVSPIELRRVAAALDSIRDELDGDAAAAAEPLSMPSEAHPEWAATASLRALTAALDEGLVMVSRLCGEAAEAMRIAAGAYEAADDRAAHRFTAFRLLQPSAE